MSSDKLQQARDHEKAALLQISKEEKPVFHLTGSTGWINDPNGFSHYQGAYHMFFQYYPYKTVWGPMHWGHAKSQDLLRWEQLPAAMAPDMPYDDQGCYSGSAIEMKDGRHLLLYTGVYRETLPSGESQERQVQCAAMGDGLDYEKYSANPVISGDQLPPGGSLQDFRDPKIWYEAEEDAYYCVTANRPADGSGSVLLFRSADGLHWDFVTTLDASKNEYGTVWECPDFYPLDGQWVLAVNPMEVEQTDLELHAGSVSMFILGDYDKKNHTFTRKKIHCIDYGLDFYAPQTLLTPDGRRVMIGWMQNWATSHAVPKNARWFGQMTLPRELRILDDRVCQNPIRELAQYRRDPVIHKDVPISGETALDGIRGRILDMTLTLRPGKEDPYKNFTLRFAIGDGKYTSLTYTPATGMVHLDRNFSGGFFFDIIRTRDFLVDPGHVLKIRMVMDRFSAELFFNDGKQAASLVFYTPQNCDGITFQAEGNALVDVEKYDLVID